MRIIILLAFLLSLITTLQAQEINQTVIDTRIKKEILSGPINLQALNTDLCKDWFLPEYQNYSPSKRILKKLGQQDLSNITITTVLGSWCHDSHREVPRFVKILEQINYPVEQMKLIAIDTYKKAPDFDAKKMDIKSVPTFIVSRNGMEIGRIIETPKRKLEKDLLKIIVKN